MQQTEMPKLKPYKQVPVFSEDAKIEISGTELMELHNFFTVFIRPTKVIQDVFAKNIASGVIQIKYLDENDKEIPQEEIQEQLRKLSEYFQNQANQTATEDNKEITETPNPTELKAV